MGALTWFNETTSKTAGAVLKPVFEGVGQILEASLIIFVGELPMILTIGGLVAFMLTIALAHHKPFFWGLGLWAAGAIVKVIGIELGI